MNKGHDIDQLRVLWLGPWHSDDALFGRKAVNQAATTWSRGLLQGLQKAGCEVRVCTHCREQYWPGGDLFPGNKEDFDKSLPFDYVKYINLPSMRNPTLVTAYKRMVAKQISEFKPHYVLSYNLHSYHCCLSDIINASGSKWIPIILDQDDPEDDNWAVFNKQSEGAAGYVFLSWWGYKNSPSRLPALHFDGGIERWLGEENAGKKERIVVYSGKYNEKYGGLDVLFDILKNVKIPDCKFCLTGKDAKGMLMKYLRKEKRAQYLGFLSDAALHDIQQKASVFINPRPPEISDNKMAFPSKLLNYISYGKPIVSTWTEGLAPEYKELLWCADSEENYVEQCAFLIDHALNAPKAERKLIYNKQKAWVESGHTWNMQCERLVNWLKQIS